MAQSLSPFAGQLPEPGDLIDVQRLIKAFETEEPDPTVPAQRVQFGTSGHRGSSLQKTFNRNHILAITQAICLYRHKQGITGPLFLGFDTHALSLPAFETALEVLAANEVTVLIARNQEFTPTPVISHAILNYNKYREEGLADGIVITPSHNPPDEGGFKYNPPHGGPAEKEITDWIQTHANGILEVKMSGVRKVPFSAAHEAATTRHHDFITPYVSDLGHVIDMDVIRHSQIEVAVDPLGGAGVHYWPRIVEFYKINLAVLSTKVDPCFRFMTRDWDGRIRMDPSSPYAMKGLIQEGANYDVAFACDTDHDRHGIVTKSGLMAPNPFLSASVLYLFRNRPQWPRNLEVGKTMVSSQMIDRVAKVLEHSVYEVPVGFKWFVSRFMDSHLGFAGEESAGATFLRKDGHVWTTDKDGMIMGLLAAEMTARDGQDPFRFYEDMEDSLGKLFYRRVDRPATQVLRDKLSKISPTQIHKKKLAGYPVEKILSKGPGNGASFGGVKIETQYGWVALRPSGTEDIYKVYAESYSGEDHLQSLLNEGENLARQIFET